MAPPPTPILALELPGIWGKEKRAITNSRRKKKSSLCFWFGMNYVFVQFALSDSVSSQSLAAFDSRNPKFRVLCKEEVGLRGLGEACAAAGLAEGALQSGVGLSRASSCHRPHLFLELRPLSALCSGSYWLPILLFPGRSWYFLNCVISSITQFTTSAQFQPFSSVSLCEGTNSTLLQRGRK